MNNLIAKKHIVKIPKTITFYYCDVKHMVFFVNSFTRRTIVLKTKLIIDEKKRFLKVTRESFFKTSNNKKRLFKVIQGTQVSLLKQIFLDMTWLSCKKLNLVGIGFRVSLLKLWNTHLLHFKLGFSHFIYFRIPKNFKFFCLKPNQFFILGNSYLSVSQIAALIKAYKIPDPYKGKGIRYTTENLLLKKGKKI